LGKKSRSKTAPTTRAEGEVGPRQPCPCGSGRRYKACHGSAAGPVAPYVSRPFEGISGECDLIAMREIIAAATTPLSLEPGTADGRDVTLCTLLPMAAPALARADGSVWLGLQVLHGFGDPSRDLAAVLLRALDAEPGAVGLTDPPGEGPRLQDLLTDAPFDVTVHEGFDFWIGDDPDDPTGAAAAAVESANAQASRSSRLSSVEAAYWTDVGNREHLRWVMPYDEEPLLDALARLHVSGSDKVAEGSRFVGMFRAHGLLVPVWDLPSGTGADALEEPAARFGRDLEEALADDSPLSGNERAARSGLTNRQLTLR
jgi:hypothetical protein